MALANTLNTNEVKNRLGTEVEYTRLWSSTAGTEFSKIGEEYARQQRLFVKHATVGSGFGAVRRSMFGFKDDVSSDVDTSKIVPITAHLVLQIPIGALLSQNPVADVLAKMMSFLASTGADTTIKYDCTGNGAKVLLNGDV